MEDVEGGGGLVEALLEGGGTKVLPAGGLVWERVELLLFLRFDENPKFFNREVMSESERENKFSRRRKWGESKKEGGWAAGIQPWTVLFFG